MLIPTKHEILEKNILVVGADVISLIKKKPYNLEALFEVLKKNRSIGLDHFYNVLLFLWLSEIIELDQYTIFYKKA